MASQKSVPINPAESAPPSNSANAPPTSEPPKTSSQHTTFRHAHEVVELFKSIKSGELLLEAEPWNKFQLQPGEYQEIERLVLTDKDTLLKDFVKHKVRYDFDRDRDELIVRKPSRLHERFILLVRRDINAQFRLLATSATKPVRDIIYCVNDKSCADIFFPTSADGDVSNASYKPSKNS